MKSTELPLKKADNCNKSAIIRKGSPTSKPMFNGQAQIKSSSPITLKCPDGVIKNKTKLIHLKESSLEINPELDPTIFKAPKKEIKVPKFLSKSKGKSTTNSPQKNEVK
jgi:hypothetical protein